MTVWEQDPVPLSSFCTQSHNFFFTLHTTFFFRLFPPFTLSSGLLSPSGVRWGYSLYLISLSALFWNTPTLQSTCALDSRILIDYIQNIQCMRDLYARLNPNTYELSLIEHVPANTAVFLGILLYFSIFRYYPVWLFLPSKSHNLYLYLVMKNHFLSQCKNTGFHTIISCCLNTNQLKWVFTNWSALNINN